jgi:hypothetical protein
MKIIMQTAISGPEYSFRKGQEADLPEQTAKSLVERGLAVPVRVEKRETAVKKPVKERASKE